MRERELRQSETPIEQDETRRARFFPFTPRQTLPVTYRDEHAQPQL
jgi:hypothetical protein